MVHAMVDSALHSNRSSRNNSSVRHDDVVFRDRTHTQLSTTSTLKDYSVEDPLMSEVFGAVKLPHVEFSCSARNSQIHSGVTSPEPHDCRDHEHDHHNHHEDFSHVLNAMENDLAKEETHSYRSSLSSLASPTSPHEPENFVAHHVVENAFSEHHNDHSARQSEHIPSHHSSHRHSLSSIHDHRNEEELRRELDEQQAKADELMREMEDRFDEETIMSSMPTSRRSSFGNLSARHRSMTVDSLVSTAESRFGDFDVHADEDSDINLLHDDVAYQRPRKPKANGFAVGNGFSEPHRPSAAELAELEETHRRLAMAQQAIAVLEHKLASAKAHAATIAHHEHQRPQAAPITNNHHARSASYGGENLHQRFSQEGGFIYEEDVGISDLARSQLQKGTEIGRVGSKVLIVPQMHEDGHFEKHGDIKKIIVGGEQPRSNEDKTVLLFGPTGSGKSSLINSMMDYLYDVRKENGFRFVVSEKTLPSRGLRAYVFNNTVLPFSVTIVDTPGVPDRKGDTTVSNLVETWFKQELFSGGHFRLDAISIVLRHDERRLEWPFIYELAAVKKMFGDDLKTNVLPIITNTEVLPQPVAVRALAQANISFLQYYKVNNGGFFPEPTEGMSRLKHSLFYKHGSASLEKFFKDLQEIIHPLLAVLRNHRVSSADVY